MHLNLFFKSMNLMLMIIMNLMTIMMNDIFIMWLLMEVNTILFTTMLIHEKNKNMMYYLIQMLSSLMILASMIMMSWYNWFNMWIYLFEFSIFIKLGIIPNFKWMHFICNDMTNNLLIIFLTLTKFIPFMLLKLVIMNTLLMTYIFFITAIMSTILNFKYMNFNLILMYSSLFHSFFMIIILNNNYMFMIYFIFYSLSITILMMFKNNLPSNNLNVTYLKKFTLMILSLNYLGILPFMGFYYKWMTAQIYSKSITLLLLMIMMMMMLLFIFYFFRMIYSYTIINKSSYKNINKLIKYKMSLFIYLIPFTFMGMFLYMFFSY